MCLTTAALKLFLSLLPPEIVAETETVITVHATAGDVVWERGPDRWCRARGDEASPAL